MDVSLRKKERPPVGSDLLRFGINWLSIHVVVQMSVGSYCKIPICGGVFLLDSYFRYQLTIAGRSRLEVDTFA